MAKSTRILHSALTWFLWRTVPASRKAKPPCMANTSTAPTSRNSTSAPLCSPSTAFWMSGMPQSPPKARLMFVQRPGATSACPKYRQKERSASVKGLRAALPTAGTKRVAAALTAPGAGSCRGRLPASRAWACTCRRRSRAPGVRMCRRQSSLKISMPQNSLSTIMQPRIGVLGLAPCPSTCRRSRTPCRRAGRSPGCGGCRACSRRRDR